MVPVHDPCVEQRRYSMAVPRPSLAPGWHRRGVPWNCGVRRARHFRVRFAATGDTKGAVRGRTPVLERWEMPRPYGDGHDRTWWLSKTRGLR